MKRTISVIIHLAFVLLCINAQTFWNTRTFTPKEGLFLEIITEVLQTDDGYLWFATWDGIMRYDGYDFVTFRQDNAKNRITTARLIKSGILIQDYNSKYKLFDTNTLSFRAATAAEIKSTTINPLQVKRSDLDITVPEEHKVRAIFKDNQKNLWILMDRGMVYMSQHKQTFKESLNRRKAETRALFIDSRGRFWKGGKSTDTPDGGFCELDGKPLNVKCRPYAFAEDAQGNILIASKKNGIFIANSNGIKPYDYNVPRCFCFETDRRGHILVGSHKNGVYDLTARKHIFGKEKVRLIRVLGGDSLLVATTDGVILSTGGKERKILDNRDVYTVDCINGKYYFGVYGEGLHHMKSLDEKTTRLCPYVGDKSISYIKSSFVDRNSNLWLVTSNSIISYNDKTSTFVNYGEAHFGKNIDFTECRPLMLNDGSIVVGTMTGTLTFNPDSIRNEREDMVTIAVSGIRYGDDTEIRAVRDIDSITLDASQRRCKLNLTTFNYAFAKEISFAYKMDNEKEWHYLFHDHVIHLDNLSSGNHTLQIRASDDHGIYYDNVRTITINVEPYFYESSVFWIAILLLALLATAYIYHRVQVNLQIQREKDNAGKVTVQFKNPETCDSDKEFMETLTNLLEERISDSDLRMEDIAQMMHMSYSNFYRKLKSLTGLSVVEFLKRMRIQHAARMFDAGNTKVSEVSYAVGFADPKYFSRVFKNVMGKTASEYIAENKKQKH